MRPGEQGRFVLGLTDEAGRLALADFPGERTALFVVADGRVVDSRGVAPGEDELVVTSRTGATIEGRLVPAPARTALASRGRVAAALSAEVAGALPAELRRPGIVSYPHATFGA